MCTLFPAPSGQPTSTRGPTHVLRVEAPPHSRSLPTRWTGAHCSLQPRSTRFGPQRSPSAPAASTAPSARKLSHDSDIAVQARQGSPSRLNPVPPRLLRSPVSECQGPPLNIHQIHHCREPPLVPGLGSWRCCPIDNR